MKKLLFTCCVSVLTLTGYAQYAPQAGIAGSDAIIKTSSLFVNWAAGCTVQRGLQQIDDPGAGYAQAGDSSLAIGMADGSIVSLGDSGVATLTFTKPVINGPGPDFAVFENGFLNGTNGEEAFLELAFVEVSSDGVNFFRFPATTAVQDTLQLSSVSGQMFMNARQLNNFAGKYIGGYGTPFDLQELAGQAGLNINHITHIRVVDVIGDIGAHGTKAANGRRINDPFPTPFPTGGFDLDAVGVIHQGNATMITAPAMASELMVYPNPANDEVYFGLDQAKGRVDVRLADATGRVLLQRVMSGPAGALSVQQLSNGIYYLTAQDEKGNRWVGKVFRQ